MAESNRDKWQVESLRLSVFLVDAINPVETRSWEPLFGNAPDELRIQQQQQLVTEEGPFLNGRLRAETRSNRFDWRFFPDPKNLPHELPILGSYADLESRFQDLMLRWLSNCPLIHRVAYGGVLLLPTEGLPDAYRKLDRLLPAVQIDPEKTQDLTYRINRRRDSRCGVEGLKINRLSTWSAVQILDAVIDIPASGHRPPKVTQLPNSRSLCRLELDINTIPEFVGEFDKDLVPQIFIELISIGNEIASEGDIA